MSLVCDVVNTANVGKPTKPFSNVSYNRVSLVTRFYCITVQIEMWHIHRGQQERWQGQTLHSNLFILPSKGMHTHKWWSLTAISTDVCFNIYQCQAVFFFRYFHFLILNRCTVCWCKRLRLYCTHSLFLEFICFHFILTISFPNTVFLTMVKLAGLAVSINKYK